MWFINETIQFYDDIIVYFQPLSKQRDILVHQQPQILHGPWNLIGSSNIPDCWLFVMVLLSCCNTGASGGKIRVLNLENRAAGEVKPLLVLFISAVLLVLLPPFTCSYSQPPPSCSRSTSLISLLLAPAMTGPQWPSVCACMCVCVWSGLPWRLFACLC